MRFLTVAERELRSAARHKATYRTRWITATAFCALLVWLLWALNGFSNRGAAPDIFVTFSVLAFLYCLFIATTRTADCISAERREGTLGFLFLSNLNSAEIIAGKLCSGALASVYGLLAIFPMLALPLLMGGITFGHFARTVLGLLNGILFGLAAGFLASVTCKRQVTAIACGAGFTLAMAGGLSLGAAAASSFGPTRALAPWFLDFNPLYTVLAADGTAVFGPNRYWQSLGLVAGLSFAGLAMTTLLLARTWRDRPQTAAAWRQIGFRQDPEQSSSPARDALRRRLLATNPLFWLAGRQRVSAPVFMLLAVVLTLCAVYLGVPILLKIMGTGTSRPVLAHLLAWLGAGLLIHALVLYYAAMTASQRLAEDRQTGALELILCTPISERTISRGLWLAFGRRMLFPAILAVLAHGYFIWVCMVMCTVDPPGPLPPGATPGEIFWNALLNRPLRGVRMDWELGFMLRCGVLMLLQLIAAWYTLGWVGRWLGLRMKRPGFAPSASLALVMVPPILAFSLACYLAAEFNLDRLPDRLFLPVMMWLGLAIGMGHCAALSTWAAARLRSHLRAAALSRYQPLPPWRFRLPSRRTVRRYAVGTAALAASVALLVAGYYGHQNRRSRRAWQSFEASLKQTGEPLDLAPLLPEPVPDSRNFARAPAFQAFQLNADPETVQFIQRTRPFGLLDDYPQVQAAFMDWIRQSPSPLKPFVSWTPPPAGKVPPENRRESAAAVLVGLQPYAPRLEALAEAAAQFPAFQTSTNRDARAVLHSGSPETLLLERLHLVLQVRASASIESGRTAEAAEDVLTGLRLARLARQCSDTRSTVRTQMLLGRSLQPIWEGLARRVWTEPQIAAMQRELAEFNLLSDYTNTVRRVVLAHIEVWRQFPDGAKPHEALLPPGIATPVSERTWKLQPGGWWFDHCIQLHQAGRNAVSVVDAAGGRVGMGSAWSDLEGLPLDSDTTALLLQSWWWLPTPATVAFAQTALNQALAACALERFRLAKGRYPENLQQLVPDQLPGVPPDACTGRPVLYQIMEDGSVRLRGVGPNGKDDRAFKSSDDWVWAYPTNAPSAGPAE